MRLSDVFSQPQSSLAQLDAEWAQKQSELTAALNKDKERMIKLNEMLNRVSHTVPSKSNLSW
jgi:hypothetical protein